MIVMITVLIEILLYQMLFNDVNVLIQICYVFVSILLYIIIIFITLHRFQENKVSTILKDSKD